MFGNEDVIGKSRDEVCGGVAAAASAEAAGASPVGASLTSPREINLALTVVVYLPGDIS